LRSQAEQATQRITELEEQLARKSVGYLEHDATRQQADELRQRVETLQAELSRQTEEFEQERARTQKNVPAQAPSRWWRFWE
jgi:oligoendopeptidase F